MRTVLDTNIVISGFVWGGKPRLLLNAARAGRLQIATSQPLIIELAQVVYRSKFAGPLSRARLTPSTVMKEYQQLSMLVSPANIERTASDPDDDVVLGTALAARADLIISGDQHLLTLGSFEGIPIVSVAGALERIEAAGQERSVH